MLRLCNVFSTTSSQSVFEPPNRPVVRSSAPTTSHPSENNASMLARSKSRFGVRRDDGDAALDEETRIMSGPAPEVEYGAFAAFEKIHPPFQPYIAVCLFAVETAEDAIPSLALAFHAINELRRNLGRIP